MYDHTILEAGVNTLARAHALDYFADGHRGAAMIAGYYLLREHPLSPGTVDWIAERVRSQWIAPGRVLPFPAEPSEPALLTRITEAMAGNLSGLRQAGHNVILPTLALKALRDVPHLITPSRVAGICALLPKFTVQSTALQQPLPDFPDYTDTASAAEWILREFIACGERFDRRGQGWTGHLLTYGRALLDLRELGDTALAQQAEAGFALYIERIRSGPLDTDRVWAEHTPNAALPTEDAYWHHPDRAGDWGLGHVLKYPYGLYGLLQLAKDETLKAECLAAAYRVV